MDSVDEFKDTLAALAREAVDAGDATTMARAFGNIKILPVLYGPVSDHLRVSVDAACMDAHILHLSPGGDSIARLDSSHRKLTAPECEWDFTEFIRQSPADLAAKSA